MADESKGKGKATTSSSTPRNADGATQPRSTSSDAGGASSAAQSLTSALRSTMASNQLSSLMQSVSGGKAEFAPSGSSANGELRDWLVQDLRSSSTGSTSPTVQGKAGRGFRSAPLQAGGEGQEGMYSDFERGLTLNDAAAGASHFRPDVGESIQASRALNQVWHDRVDIGEGTAKRWQSTGLDPSTAQPIGSYTELDEPLHASVRAASTSLPHADRTYAAPPAAPLAATDDIFALLDDEAQASTSQPSNSLSDVVFSHFDPHYRPPSPSHPSFSRDQATLHLQLAEAQASEQGRQELLVPRPDNPALQEGVYAPTAEAALQSIFDGRVESSDVKETEEGERGHEVVRKITRWFGASTYLDDVYGQAPLLRETIEEATKPKAENADAEEKRARAIRRLESLWNHLSNTPPAPEAARSSDWVDGWLRKNT